jgi:hypothetical protein
MEYGSTPIVRILTQSDHDYVATAWVRDYDTYQWSAPPHPTAQHLNHQVSIEWDIQGGQLDGVPNWSQDQGKTIVNLPITRPGLLASGVTVHRTDSFYYTDNGDATLKDPNKMSQNTVKWRFVEPTAEEPGEPDDQ